MSEDTIRLVIELASLFIVTAGILSRLSAMTTRFEMIGIQQAEEIKELKGAVKELVTQTTRLDRVEERMLAEGKRVDELTTRVNRVSNGVHHD